MTMFKINFKCSSFDKDTFLKNIKACFAWTSGKFIFLFNNLSFLCLYILTGY